jgi:hypothetical protein
MDDYFKYKRHRKRIFLLVLYYGLMICFLGSFSSCNSLTTSGKPSQTITRMTPTVEVEITHWLAAANGTLISIDGCLKLRSSDYINKDYSIVWTPDFLVTIEGNSIKVTSGIVSGIHKEFLLFIGEKVTLGGGTVNELSNELKNTVPANCTKPYWIVGSIVSPQR